MILIDAVFIHTGGGKSLLDYLISELNKTDAEVSYLLDLRYKSQMPEINGNVEFVNGFFNRCKFYNKNKNKFSKIFCLGNIPPHLPLKHTQVLMYLHSASYLNTGVQTTLKQKITQYVKNKIFYALLKNSNLWMVQTGYIQKLFQKKAGIPTHKIKVLPFFKSIEKSSEIINKEKNSFFYPGTAEPHKNHKRLIDAFCIFYDQYKIGYLYLTVEERFKEIFDYINLKKSQSYPIINLGYISNKKDVGKAYYKAEYLVFPSLLESFGLPLIEAPEFNCKIIASKLDYVAQVCVPSYTFDPYDVLNMSEAFANVVQHNNLPESHAIVHNEINQVISYIINEKN
ncbi:glycosyltransferase [Chryseobacterium tongliaoense]|uniref:glycosyltransferase n=1 Tax=Chryseobacterium tongliaoense TaxID=3240933 RepID=UPI0035167259